jgi:hypothetical protein
MAFIKSGESNKRGHDAGDRIQKVGFRCKQLTGALRTAWQGSWSSTNINNLSHPMLCRRTPAIRGSLVLQASIIHSIPRTISTYCSLIRLLTTRIFLLSIRSDCIPFKKTCPWSSAAEHTTSCFASLLPVQFATSAVPHSYPHCHATSTLRGRWRSAAHSRPRWR